MIRRALPLPVKSIRTGLCILFLALLAALTALFTLVQGGALARASRDDLAATLERMELHLEREAVLSAGQLAAQAAQPLAGLDFTGLCANLAATVESRRELLAARAIHADGRIFASSDMTELGAVPDVPLPDWSGAAGSRVRRTRHGGADALEAAVPIVVAGETWGTLLLHYSLSPLTEAAALETSRTDARIRGFWLSSALIGVAILLSGSIAAIRLGRLVADPVIRLAASSRLIAEGDLDRPIPRVGKNELASLSESMEEMRRSMRTRMADLQAILDTGRSMASRLEKEDLYRETGEAIRDRFAGYSVALIAPAEDGWKEEAVFGDAPDPAILEEALAWAASSPPPAGRLQESAQGALLQPVALPDRLLAAIVAYPAAGTESKAGREERPFLETVANFLAVSLMNVELFAETRRGERIAHEMETARAVQAALFPREDPRLDWLDVSGVFLPATETGGDWFGYIHRPGSDHFLVLIGDVTGHGVPPALVTAAVRGSCATLAESGAGDSLSPARVLEELNRIVFRTGRRDLVMTLFAARFDRRSGAVTYANAGHPLPIVTAADGRHDVLAVRGPRLGDLERPRFRERTRALSPGETVLFYTDGLADNRNETGDSLGRRGIRSMLRAHRSGGARQIRDRLLETVRSPAAGDERRDDVAMVVAKRRGNAPRLPEGAA